MHAHLPESATPPATPPATQAADGALSTGVPADALAGILAGSLAGTLANSGARWALAGFFISGVLLSFLGAILPSWQHHISSDYGIISLYFVGLIVGLAGSVWAAPKLLEKKGISWTLACACAVAGSAFLYLAFVSPPLSPWWRVAGMVIVGCAAGGLHTAIFHAISPMYRHDPAATVNLAGILFGLGCLTVALLVSATFYVYTASSVQF